MTGTGAVRLYGCVRCPADVAMKPREAFERTGKRISSVCKDCRRKEAEERERRRREREAKRATRTLDDGTTVRRCYVCREWKPLEVAFAPMKRAADGSVARYDYGCRSCRSAKMSAHDRRMRMNPETAAEWRARRNEAQRAWRASSPEAKAKAREYQRAWRERLKADPVRHAAYLADQRINHRLRREREGLPLGTGLSHAIGRYASNAGRGHGKDVEPLRVWLATVFAQDGRGWDELASVMQVSERVLNRVLRHEYDTVSVGVADRLVWGYGKAVRIDGDAVQAELERRCREMPGNGERILRYIDLAERIAHLDGAVVDRVEDLWPELA